MWQLCAQMPAGVLTQTCRQMLVWRQPQLKLDCAVKLNSRASQQKLCQQCQWKSLLPSMEKAGMRTTSRHNRTVFSNAVRLLGVTVKHIPPFTVLQCDCNDASSTEVQAAEFVMVCRQRQKQRLRSLCQCLCLQTITDSPARTSARDASLQPKCSTALSDVRYYNEGYAQSVSAHWP